jgi:tRNA G10  N-methylase Trm11
MNTQKAQAGTFILNKIEPIHRWYSYMEGYSSCFVEEILTALEKKDIKTIYDPFGGCGTTPLVATQYGIKPYYSEINPFMQGIVNTKINVVRRVGRSKKKLDTLENFIGTASKLQVQKSLIPQTWNGFEKFFEDEQLSAVLLLKNKIDKIIDKDCNAICMLALSSILVSASKMIRRGDLRFATENEKKPQDKKVVENFTKKLYEIVSDVKEYSERLKSDVQLLSEDARNIDVLDYFDCIVTSPPYLNGTNYFRNTKLELKLNDFINDEADMPNFHERGIIAGINNVSKRNGNIAVLPVVVPYIKELEPVAYDKRIVSMVAGYFSDMERVIQKLSLAIKDEGVFIMDIGDSQFAVVHIPTHDILAKICEANGFRMTDENILRERKSKNGMVLTQRIMSFKLKKQKTSKELFKEKSKLFIDNLPYKKEPFAGRNWGHSWHSLCSYHGKLKPAIAHMLVDYFTEKKDVVLDPLCGVGTIPFEACLQGRIGIGNDLSEMAYIVTKAKLEKPSKEDVLAALSRLRKYIIKCKDTEKIIKLKIQYNDFGLNGKISYYFENNTYSEILAAREYFKNKINTLSSADCMVFSCLLHILHGNRPYALSRNSHPLTPYAPKGGFVYKNVIDYIKNKIELAYKEKSFDNYSRGYVLYGDYQEIKNLKNKVDIIICSPPFAGSIRFYMNNWMRLWLCGWEPHDFKGADTKFLDNKQKKDFSVYQSFFKMCNNVLKPEGRIVLHLGKTEKYNMAKEIIPYAEKWFEILLIGEESVQNIEKHGIKDKGGTTAHQFMFLFKK